MALIPRPDLYIANEEELAAQAIARTTGPLTTDLIDSYIAAFGELRKLVEAGNLTPICPELTNANPSAAHTVILETLAWMLAQMGYRINQIPEQNLIEFARLFGIELRASTKAQTMIRFTTAQALADVTVPAGTRIATADESIVFETTEDLIILFGSPNGSITAQNIVAGHTLVSSNKLTKILDNIAFIGAATNLFAIDSGTETETVESALERMRQYQRRAERIVSSKDLEEAILEALDGNAVVRVFPFIVNGEFLTQKPKAGHTTVIVMTRTGENIDSIAEAKIAALLDQAVGNQYIYVVNPSFVEFNISVNVRLNTGSPQGAVVAAIERNLRNFYAASREQFGRAIYRSEIIAIIESTSGVDRIEPESADQILSSPAADLKLQEFELAKLVEVTIDVV